MRLRRRRYHTGGGIPPHKHPHDVLEPTDDISKDSNILGSLVPPPEQADATRVNLPGMQPLQPGTQPITIIEDPEVAQMKTLFKEQYGDDWEKKYDEFNEKITKEKAEDDVKIKQIMIGQFQNPFYDQGPWDADQVFKGFQEEKGYKPGTFYSRKEAEDILFDSKFYSALDPNLRGSGAIQMAGPFNDPIFGILLGGQQVVRSSVGAGLNWLYKPMLKKIPGLGGVTGHHILSAMGLGHMIKETPKSIQEFIDNPSPGQALHVTWDALMGVPGMIELKKGIPASISAFRNSKNLAKFRRGPDGLGSFFWDDAAKNWRKMTQAEIDWLAAAEARNPKLIGALTESAEGGAALQQTGALRQLAASDAPVAASEGGLFGGKFTFKGLKDFLLPKPELTVQSGKLSLKDIHSDKMTDAMMEGEKFVSQYYLNANVLDRLGQLYGPLGTGQLYDLEINKTFDSVASNLADKNFSYKYPQGDITFSGKEGLQRYIKGQYTGRAMWSTMGLEKGSELFPFELSKMGSGMGSFGTYTNRHFPGVLVSEVGGLGRTDPYETVEMFTPREIRDIYFNKPFGVHPDDFKQSLIDTYGQEDGLKYYNKVGGLRYKAKNQAGNLARTYGVKSDVNRMLDEKGRFTDPSRTWNMAMQQKHDDAVRTVVHEMNHYYFGITNLPNELIVPWMQYLTDEANIHLFSRYPDTKKVGYGIEYHSQPVEIQARTGELRYEMVNQILKNKGITLTNDTPDSQVNEAINDLEIILKNDDVDAFNKIFGAKDGKIANSIRVPFRNIIKGNNFEEKRRNFMDLMKIVPVVGAPFALGAALDEEEEDLPILGYKKGGILQAMAKKNTPDKNKFVSKKVRILRREGKGLRQAVAIALDMYEKKKQEKKFQEGGLFEKLKNRREKIKAAKDFYLKEEENPFMDEEGRIMMPVSGNKEQEITPGQYRRYKKGQFRDYKRGLRKAGRETRQQDRQERRDERIKERGYRRVGKADVKPFDTQSILDYLAGENTAGYYLGPQMGGRLMYGKRFKDQVGNVMMNPVVDNTGLISSVEKGADDSVLDHELIHKSQYGPLQKLASYFGLPGAGRIQDKGTRKAYKNLMKSIRKGDTVLDENLGGPAQADYMTGARSRDIEFDAIVKSGLSSASAAGYDLEGKSFDEIISILKQAEKDKNASTNMGHLNRFMRGTNWTDEQKGFIMDAIKANLGREAFTAEDARQDLR